jgi:hypothetical protein
VGRLWCPEFIPDIEKFLAFSIFKMATTIPHKSTHIWNVVEIGQCWICAVLWQPFLKMATARNFSMSGINLGHHNLPTYEMVVKIQHFPISSKFYIWVDNNVPTLTNFYRSPFPNLPTYEIRQCWICAVLWRPFWKWWPLEIFHCRESIRDILIYPHMKCRWNRTKR